MNNSYNNSPFENGNILPNTYSSPRIRAPYRISKPVAKKVENFTFPKKASDVPQELRDIFPSQDFFEPEYVPGIFVLFFPSTTSGGRKTVYIGQSVKVKREIAETKTPRSLSNRPYLKALFDNTGMSNVKFYTLSQGPELADRTVRLREETQFIQKAGIYAANIAGNIHNPSITRFKSNPNVINPVLHKREKPWNSVNGKCINGTSETQISLHYPILPEKPSESCLYLFRNNKTGSFYIGQSANSHIIDRINKHKSNIRKVQFWELEGKKIGESVIYDKIISDIKKGGKEFEYSIIEYCDQLTRTERLQREHQVIAEAILKYGNRVYNNLNKQIRQNLLQLRQLEKTYSISTSKEILLPYYERNLSQVVKYKRIVYPVIANNKYYDSLSQAAIDLKISRETIKSYCLSNSFPHFIWLQTPLNKKIPSISEVQSKLDKFNKLLDAFKKKDVT